MTSRATLRFLHFIVSPADPLSSLFLRNRPAIPPAILRLVKSRICPVEESFPVFLMGPVLCNSNADCDGNLLFTGLDEQGPYIFAEPFGLLARRFERAMGQDDQELLAAIAPDRIGIADMISQLACQSPQHLIAHGMTIGIVDLFEKIDVQHRDGKRRTVMIREEDLVL